MKAKDNAKELVEKFSRKEDAYYIQEIAKENALICVDEIINNQYDHTSKAFDNYWQEVKKEIELL